MFTDETPIFATVTYPTKASKSEGIAAVLRQLQEKTEITINGRRLRRLRFRSMLRKGWLSMDVVLLIVNTVLDANKYFRDTEIP